MKERWPGGRDQSGMPALNAANSSAVEMRREWRKQGLCRDCGATLSPKRERYCDDCVEAIIASDMGD